MALRISKQLPSGWPLITPAWPLNPAMRYTIVRGSCNQIWQPSGISQQFDLWLTPADPCMTFDPSNELHFDQGYFLPNLVAIWHFKSIWHLVDPGWRTPAWHLTPSMHYTLVRGSSHQICWQKGIAKQIDPYLTPADPYMAFDPSNALGLRYGQGFFPPNLVAMGHC